MPSIAEMRSKLEKKVFGKQNSMKIVDSYTKVEVNTFLHETEMLQKSFIIAMMYRREVFCIIFFVQQCWIWSKKNAAEKYLQI